MILEDSQNFSSAFVVTLPLMQDERWVHQYMASYNE